MMLGTTFGAGLMSPPFASGQAEEPTAGVPVWQVIPSITVSERYDSNVFFVTTGQNLEDYVTTVVPQLKVVHSGRLIQGDIHGGVTGEQYVNNPGLSYIAPNGGFVANLDGMVQQWIPKASLQLSDDFVFTPRPPAFLAPEAGNVAPDAFVRGIQTQRANSISNMGTAAGAYALSPTAAFQTSYMHQFIRFGNTFADPVFGSFFDTTFQTVTAGPQIQVSPRDTMTLFYQYQQGNFVGGGFGSGFYTHGGLAGWKRALTPSLTGSLSAGAAVVNPGNSLQYMGDVGLEWKHQSTTATARYSRAITPSFFIGGLPLLSQVATALVSHQASDVVSLFVGADYAQNESVPNPLLSFTSAAGRTGVNYLFSRLVTATLTYSYSQFGYRFQGSDAEFDRHAVMLTVKVEWK
jgi:hypothetical protein